MTTQPKEERKLIKTIFNWGFWIIIFVGVIGIIVAGFSLFFFLSFVKTHKIKIFPWNILPAITAMFVGLGIWIVRHAKNVLNQDNRIQEIEQKERGLQKKQIEIEQKEFFDVLLLASEQNTKQPARIAAISRLPFYINQENELYQKMGISLLSALLKESSERLKQEFSEQPKNISPPVRHKDLQKRDLLHNTLKIATETVKKHLKNGIFNFVDLSGFNLKDANLQGAQLNNANLQGANLEGANLQLAELKHAKLQCAYLDDAELQCAELQCAVLTNARLDNVKLQGAQLQGANLEVASLEGANLQGANLQGASFTETKTADVDFTGSYVWSLIPDDKRKEFIERGAIEERFQRKEKLPSLTTKKEERVEKAKATHA